MRMRRGRQDEALPKQEIVEGAESQDLSVGVVENGAVCLAHSGEGEAFHSRAIVGGGESVRLS